MRVLLDTNIIIHRENSRITNESIGRLFYWLDNLRCDKLIHPYTIDEINKYNDKQIQDIYKVKLTAYNQLKTVAAQTDEFISKLTGTPKTENDLIDNQLLCELFSGRVDALITEDRKMRNKAINLGISSKVYSINSFIEFATNSHPELITYKMLSVKKERFGNIDINDQFFNTFKSDYKGFECWFAKKCDEEAYICQTEEKKIQGFLYLKVENENENYNDIFPQFIPKVRLKVGTFKVESTGFRLGERFLKIIFDNAIQYKVDEIYVTLFKDRSELKALRGLLCRWGFTEFGEKVSNGKHEIVLVKRINYYNSDFTPKENFPNINYSNRKFFLPILPAYHTRLLPDSILKTEAEINFLDKSAEKYALEKVYISLSYKRDMHPGDIIAVYRSGQTSGQKAYESVVTTVGVINELSYGFQSKQEFLDVCQNRTVFTTAELNDLWNKHHSNLLVVKFIIIKSLAKRPILKNLWDEKIVELHKGPRPFDEITANEFDKLLELSKTDLYRGAN